MKSKYYPLAYAVRAQQLLPYISFNKEGETKTSWNCSVWDVANVIRKPEGASNFSSGTGRLGPADDEYKKKIEQNTGYDYDSGEA